LGSTEDEERERSQRTSNVEASFFFEAEKHSLPICTHLCRREVSVSHATTLANAAYLSGRHDSLKKGGKSLLDMLESAKQEGGNVSESLFASPLNLP